MWFTPLGWESKLSDCRGANRRHPLAALCGALILLTRCGPPSETVFDGDRAYAHVVAQCDLGNRPTGSAAAAATGDYIIGELAASGWETDTEEFFYRDTRVRNVVGRAGRGPVVILGAHYDTRRSADREDPSAPVLGANDGASGVAVLLELARVLDLHDLQNEVWLAFFDAEDNGGLDGWEWCVGSQHMASHLSSVPVAVVVVDMVGDVDQSLFYERNSDSALMADIWDVGHRLGYGDVFIREWRWALYDDHVPFARRGVPAVDIIDFDYPHWHTTRDTPEKVDAMSLERVGRVLEVWVEERVP
jgi:glutaminyl-peptide cyclotransferase